MVCMQGQRATFCFLASKLERYIRKSLSSHCRFVIFPRNQLRILQTAPFVNRHPHAALLPVQCIESAQAALKLPHTRISSQSSTSYLLKVFFRISQHFVLRSSKIFDILLASRRAPDDIQKSEVILYFTIARKSPSFSPA